jgi:hypothetical protein
MALAMDGAHANIEARSHLLGDDESPPPKEHAGQKSRRRKTTEVDALPVRRPL